MSQPQPPWNPDGQQGKQPYPGEQYGQSSPPPQDPRQPLPGWYPDPGGQQILRWWDGRQWGPQTQALPPQASAAQGTQPGPPQATAATAARKRRKTVAAVLGVIVAGAIAVVIDLVAGQGGSDLASTSVGPLPPTAIPSSAFHTQAQGAPSSAADAGAPSSSPSAVMCTSHSCIVQILQQNLTGLVAQDESVATKVTCYKSSVVFHAAADTYSASCTVTYSDGSSASGTGNLDVSQQKVTFEPED